MSQLIKQATTKKLVATVLTLLAMIVPTMARASEANVVLQFSSQDQIYLGISFLFGLIAILVAWYIAGSIRSMSPGNDKMQDVGRAIKQGALAYLRQQVTTMSMFVVVLAVVLALIFGGQYGSPIKGVWTAVSFVLGVSASYIAGYVGMLLAVEGNMRTANAALTSYANALRVAFRSGAVAGLITVGMGLIGATAILFLGKEDAMKYLIGFGFGGSLAALFMRVGGGIFTKAADVGADLVGKVEAGIPEDDPRNPAVIADNVGDNVGDCAGMAADVFESYEVTLVAAIVLGAATASIFDQSTWMKLVLFALMARGVGIIASILGIFMVSGSDDIKSNPLHSIKKGFTTSAFVSIVGTAILAYFLMGGTGEPIQTTQFVSGDQAARKETLAIQSIQRTVAKEKKLKEEDLWRITTDEIQFHPDFAKLGIDDAQAASKITAALQSDPDKLPPLKTFSGYHPLDLNSKNPILGYTAMSSTTPGSPQTPVEFKTDATVDGKGTELKKYEMFALVITPKPTTGASPEALEPRIINYGPVTEKALDDQISEAKSFATVVKVARYKCNLYVNAEGKAIWGVDSIPVLTDKSLPTLIKDQETKVASAKEAFLKEIEAQASVDPAVAALKGLTNPTDVARKISETRRADGYKSSPNVEAAFTSITSKRTVLALMESASTALRSISKFEKLQNLAGSSPLFLYRVSIDEYKKNQEQATKAQESASRNPTAAAAPQVPQPPTMQTETVLAVHTVVPWWLFVVAIGFGILMAFAIEKLTDYYVSLEGKPVNEVAGVATAGPAPMVISGFALAQESSVFSVFAIVIALIVPLQLFPAAQYGSYILSFYGVALVGLGLLTTTGFILAMDTFGPISDNAQGVFEMSGAGHDNPEGARRVQLLDAAGNTTKALTKGFAIATAVVAAVALFHSYIESAKLAGLGLPIDVPEIFLGLLIGGAAPYLFSAFSINAVGRAAFDLINEVRTQFRNDPGIMKGTSKPNYASCVAIVTAAAQRELIGPGILAIALPMAVAFGFSIGHEPVSIGGQLYNLTGAQALGGFLAGAILSGQLMAVLLANAGGIWDNSKKLIEDGMHGGKGTEAHKAGVVCDTVGDPFKDTAGPALNPLIKVMNLVALLLAPVVIMPYNNAILVGITTVCLAALAFSTWWSKRSSMSNAMTQATGSNEAALPPVSPKAPSKRITVDDDETSADIPKAE